MKQPRASVAISILARRPSPWALESLASRVLMHARMNSAPSPSSDPDPDLALESSGDRPLPLEPVIGDQREQARALRALGAAMPSGPQRAHVLAWSGEAARRILDATARGDALLDLAEVASGDEREGLAREAVASYRAPSGDKRSLLVAVPLLPTDPAVDLAREGIAALAAEGGGPDDLTLFALRFPRAVAEALWPDALAIAEPLARARVLAALGVQSGGSARVSTAFAEVEATFDLYEPNPTAPLLWLAPTLDQKAASRAMKLVRSAEGDGSEAQIALAVRLIELGEPVEEALAAIPPERRLCAEARALPFVSSAERRGEAILETLFAMPPQDRFGLLFEIAPSLVRWCSAQALIALLDGLSERAYLSAATFLATLDGDLATALAPPAFAVGLALLEEDTPLLVSLAPLAAQVPRAMRVALLGRLFEETSRDVRNSALAGDAVSFVRMVPLFAAIGGEAGLFAVARAVVREARRAP